MVARAAAAMFVLLAFALVIVPGASGAPCDTSGPTISCERDAGPCHLEAGTNVVTTTYAGGSTDCRGGGMGTRCYAEVGVGPNLFEPTVARWCAF